MTNKTILIKSGRVIDPLSGIDEIMDVVIENEEISTVIKKIDSSRVFDEVIDASGKWVMPGLVDMHVHLREPGREDQETVMSGSQAAAAGGFTAVACMPNTMPVVDDKAKVRYLVLQGKEAKAKIHPIGSITKEQKGKELSPVGEMVAAGAVAISEDGMSVKNANLMRNALNYAKNFNIPVISHCEDPDLCNNGYMNEGEMSSFLGIRGIPSVAEDVIVARNLILAEFLNARIHIAHVSTAGSVRLIRDFKERGVAVTAEATPHHFTLDHNELKSYDTNLKMNPPLRSPKDVEEIKKALASGVIDVIASDHAPHSFEEKNCEFAIAANGIIGLETSLALTYTNLVDKGIISPTQMVERMSVAPNKILGLAGGTLKKGSVADITIFDPNVEWIVDADKFYSKSRNTPFVGYKLKGKPYKTILEGNIVKL